MKGIVLLIFIVISTFYVQIESRAKPDWDDDGFDEISFSQSESKENNSQHHRQESAPAPPILPVVPAVTSQPMAGGSPEVKEQPKKIIPTASEPEAEPASVPGPNSDVKQGQMSITNYAGYNEPCNSDEYGRHCDAANDMICSPSTHTCECDPAVNAVYIMGLRKCLKIAIKTTSFNCVANEQCHRGSMGPYSECNMETMRCQCLQSFGDVGHTEVIQHEERCYLRKRLGEYCEDDVSCDVSIEGKAVCTHKPTDPNGPPAPHVITGSKMCLCDNAYVFDNSSNGNLRECMLKGTDESSPCVANIQCTTNMGPLSRCNQGQCQCEDVVAYKSETVFHKEYCYIKLDLNDPCDSDVQCQAGIHSNAVCAKHDSYLPHEKVCRCPEGKSCTGKGGATTVVSSVNLFMLAVVATKVLL